MKVWEKSLLTGRPRSRCPVKHVFARTRPVFGRSNFNNRNSCDCEPRLHRKPFITKKQVNPSRFGNKNYKLLVLPLLAFPILQQMLRGAFSVQRDYSSWGCFQIIQSIKQSGFHFLNSQSWYLAKGKTLHLSGTLKVNKITEDTKACNRERTSNSDEIVEICDNREFLDN